MMQTKKMDEIMRNRKGISNFWVSLIIVLALLIVILLIIIAAGKNISSINPF